MRVHSIRHARYIRIKKYRSIQMHQKMYTEQFMYQFMLLPKWNRNQQPQCNIPTSTKLPGLNTQHLYPDQHIPPRRRRRRRISWDFQATPSPISQKPSEENLRDQVQSKKGGMSQEKFDYLYDKTVKFQAAYYHEWPPGSVQSLCSFPETYDTWLH